MNSNDVVGDFIEGDYASSTIVDSQSIFEPLFAAIAITAALALLVWEKGALPRAFGITMMLVAFKVVGVSAIGLLGIQDEQSELQITLIRFLGHVPSLGYALFIIFVIWHILHRRRISTDAEAQQPNEK